MTPDKIAFYDFDGTLFRSPEKPSGWTKGWWGNIVSLSPPIVPEEPGSDWWIGSVVQRAKRDIADPETLTVLITGRIASKFTARLKDLLRGVGLKFDHVYLNPGDDTEPFKLGVLDKLLKDHTTARGVDIWEDRAPHLRRYADFVESKGVAAFPHLVTVPAREPEALPEEMSRTASPEVVAARYRGVVR